MQKNLNFIFNFVYFENKKKIFNKNYNKTQCELNTTDTFRVQINSALFHVLLKFYQWKR